MEMEYSKNKFVENVTELRRRIKMPIGKFEREVGVSKGYFSRLKNSSTGNPSVSLISNIGKLIKGKTFLDALMTVYLNPLSKNEKIIFEFFSKLIKDTREGRTVWAAESADELNNPAFCDRRPHILEAPTIDDDLQTEYSYAPIVNDGENIRAVDLCVHTPINNGYEFYLVKILTDHKQVDYEGHIVKGRKVKPLCSTKKLNGELAVMLKVLYQVVKLSLMNARIPDEAQSYIDVFAGFQRSS
jgi:transcriptional regulator with XRE-family HTH domain